MVYMYEFNLTTFFIGLAVILVGIVFVRWHQKIANEFGGGVGSYERYKLYALIVCGFGLLLMLNLPAFFLNLALSSVFGN